MNTINLYRRLSHRWAPGWSDLEEEEHVGQARMTPWRMVREPQDYDDGGVYTSVATVKSRDARHVARALADSLGGSSCRHEHDCCGCSYRNISARRVSRNRYAVRMSVTYNY